MDRWNDSIEEISRLFKHAIQHTSIDDDARICILKHVGASLDSALESLRILHEDDDGRILRYADDIKRSLSQMFLVSTMEYLQNDAAENEKSTDEFLR